MVFYTIRCGVFGESCTTCPHDSLKRYFYTPALWPLPTATSLKLRLLKHTSFDVFLH